MIRFNDQLDQQEKEDFQRIVPDLIVETPRTPLAVMKFKAYAGKVGEGTVSFIKDVLKDIVSEAIKKALFGG